MKKSLIFAGMAALAAMAIFGGRRLQAQAAGYGYFQDVPMTSPYYPFIQQMHDMGLTAGCSTNPPMFCPGDPTPREQMAVFVIELENQIVALQGQVAQLQSQSGAQRLK